MVDHRAIKVSEQFIGAKSVLGDSLVGLFGLSDEVFMRRLHGFNAGRRNQIKAKSQIDHGAPQRRVLLSCRASDLPWRTQSLSEGWFPKSRCLTRANPSRWHSGQSLFRLGDHWRSIDRSRGNQGQTNWRAGAITQQQQPWNIAWTLRRFRPRIPLP